MNNNKGFITIAVIIFLPFIFIVLFGSLWTLWFIKQKHSLDNICYQSVLKAQETLIKGNQNLLRLNPYAKSLIIQKKLMNKLILASPPQVKIAARAKKQLIIKQQKALYLKQRAIIHSSNLISQQSLYNLKRRLQKKLHKILRFWGKSQFANINFQPYWPNSQIKVLTHDIASTYKRGLKHSTKQTLSATWKIDLNEIIPLWLQKIIKTKKYWQSHCSSHPHKGEHHWFALIGKDKHLLKL